MDARWNLSEEEWKMRLTAEEYHVFREKGTEQAFTGEYCELKEKGVYFCAACNQELFYSEDKFDSKTGWPSYTKPVSKESVTFKEDQKLLKKRAEVLCKRCGSHLAHGFNDAPEPTGKRFCINSKADS